MSHLIKHRFNKSNSPWLAKSLHDGSSQRKESRFSPLGRPRGSILHGRYSLIFFKQKKTVNDFDIAIFFRQFATLMSSGIPIIKSFDILEKAQSKISLKKFVSSLKRELLSGKNLSQSFFAQSHYFNEFIYQLIKLGEQTGQLDTILITIAEYQEKNLAFKKKIQKTLFYPVLLTFAAFITTFILFVFVIPRFAEIFQDKYNQLPLLTRFIFYLSQQLRQSMVWGSSLIFFFLFTLIINHPQSNSIKTKIKQIALQLPFIKSCVKKIILSRFARNLALMFTAGLPITEALKFITAISSDANFKIAIAKLRMKVTSGWQLHRAMTTDTFFPDFMIQMVKIGEESGIFEAVLNKIADFYETDVNQFITTASDLLEPLIILILGVLIGGLVIGMYLPIFKLGSAL